jgi:U4/U6 small nuclear ribonucleoprotein PRP4
MNAKRQRVDLDAIPLDDTGNYAYSTLSFDQHAKIMQDLERRKMEQSIQVPTMDDAVRLKLRELDEPVCLFGEGNVERRDRLRSLLMERLEQGEEMDYSLAVEERQEFYTQGTRELLHAREWLAHYSLPRARKRIHQQRTWQDIPLATVKTVRQALFDQFAPFSQYGSQVADDRPVARCNFSPNGQMLATAGWSGAVKLWNMPSCELRSTLIGHTDRVGDVHFHPQATLSQDPQSLNLVTSGAEGVIHLWNLVSDRPMATLYGHEARVCRTQFHPSGRFIGSASYDGTWRLWDAEKCTELLQQEGHARQVFCQSFQDDGALVATGGKDHLARVWDLRTGRSVMAMEGHVGDVVALDWSPNGHIIASGSADHSVKVWDVRKLRPIYTIPAHKSLVSDVRFYKQRSAVCALIDSQGVNVDGMYLVSGSFDGTIKLWSADDWLLRKQLSGTKVMSIDLSPDGTTIASTAYDRTFKLWSREGLTLL